MVKEISKHENHMTDEHENGRTHYDLILLLIFTIT